MKKIILLTILQLTIVMAGSFIMTEGNPLVKAEKQDATDPSIEERPQVNYERTITVKSMSELENVVENTTVSTKIIVSDGVYNSGTKLRGNTTPVLIVPETLNSVMIQGDLSLYGSNITLDGLVFNGGTDAKNGTNGGMVWNFGDNNRITNCVFDGSLRKSWIWSASGFNFEIDHNTFKNYHHSKDNIAQVLIELVSFADISAPSAYSMHHNYFKNITSNTATGFEIIEIRTRESATSDKGFCEWHFGNDVLNTDNIVIEYNLFENCDELLDLKSHGFFVRNNTFRNSTGSINLRSSKFSTVNDNYIFGEGKRGTNIRISGNEHTVYNNYLENLDENILAIEVHNGTLYDGAHEIWPAIDHSVYNNYLKNVQKGITYGRKMGDVDKPNIYPTGKAINNTFVNVTNPFYLISWGDLNMSGVDTTSNSEYNTANDPGWDMSGALDTSNVISGFIGAGL